MDELENINYSINKYTNAVDGIANKEVLFCRRCGKYFDSKSAFEYHQQMHLLKTDVNTSSHMRCIERFNCSQCDKTFDAKSTLNIHYSTECLSDRFICKHCNVNCEQIGRLREHLMYYHNYTPYLLATEGLFNDILRNHVVGNNSFERRLGNEPFNNGVSLKASEFYNIGHTEYTSGYNFESTSSSKSNNFALNLPGKAYICEISQKSSSSKCVFDMHGHSNTTDEIARKEALFCQRCSKYFDSKSAFECHVQSHLLKTDKNISSHTRCIDRFNCSECAKTFEAKSALNIHYSTECLSERFICKHCKVNCEDMGRLREHLMYCHNYTPYLLATQGLFNDILRSHEVGNNSFERRSGNEVPNDGVSVGSPEFCNMGVADYISGYKFESRCNDKPNNVASNFLDKSYICEICQESFSRKCVLDMHVQKHRVEQEKVLKKYKAFKYSTKSISVRNIEENIKSNLESKSEGFEPAILIKRNTQKIKNTDIFEVTEKYSGVQTTVTSHVDNINSTTWEKIKLKRKFKRITSLSELEIQESSKPKNSEIRLKTMSSKHKTSKIKNTDIYEIIKEHNNVPNSISPLCDNDTPPWEEIELKRKFESALRSTEANIVKAKKGIRKFDEKKLKDTKDFNPRLQSVEVRNDSYDACQYPNMPSKNVPFFDHQSEAGSSRNIMKASPQRKISAHKKNQQISNLSQKKKAKKVFICEICRKKFNDGYKLKRHFFIHSGERPYSCKTCNKTFARDDHLKRHIRRVCREKKVSHYNKFACTEIEKAE